MKLSIEEAEAHWDAVEARINDALPRPHFTTDNDGYWESRAEKAHDSRRHLEPEPDVERNEWL